MVAGPAGISDEFISRRVHHGIGPPVQAPEVTTKVFSSRSAGAITKACDDATATARRDQLRQSGWAQAEVWLRLIATAGYEASASAAAADQKGAPGDVQARRVHIPRGGKRPLRNRLHLDRAGTTKKQWRARWDALRNASA